jgi:hypothetical protein
LHFTFFTLHFALDDFIYEIVEYFGKKVAQIWHSPSR